MRGTEGAFVLLPKGFGFVLRFVTCGAFGALIVCGGVSPWMQGQTGKLTHSETLPISQLVQPADLVRELASANADSRPTIVYVGFRTLFAGGHVPGATYHGSASTQQGLADIKQWAASLPRTTNLAIYSVCGPSVRRAHFLPVFAPLSHTRFP